MATYEPSMTEERSAMPVGCVPAAETAARHRQTATAAPSAAGMTATPTAHAAATAHMTATTMAVRHGKRGQ
jgi:hypothetical protein